MNRPATRIGVLLANLGSPDAPARRAVRAYLRQFLADRWVVDAPRLRWWLVRQLVVLPFRPRRIAPRYRAVWTEQGSPLLSITRRQRLGLQSTLSGRLGEGIEVAAGMRYGTPSLEETLRFLEATGCRRLLVLPMYPQYSGATTGSTVAAVAEIVARGSWRPEVRNVYGYAKQKTYIRALASSVHELWAGEGADARLLVSFHGLPSRYAAAGDPYPEQCRATADLLADSLGLAPDRWSVAYQSRMGREPWLGPSTEDVLADWGRQPVASVGVVCPGFAADCLETLDEIAVSGRALFEGAGGGRFSYVPALNDRPDHIAALADLVEENLAGWV